jgi:hypothetical protein
MMIFQINFFDFTGFLSIISLISAISKESDHLSGSRRFLSKDQVTTHRTGESNAKKFFPALNTDRVSNVSFPSLRLNSGPDN